MYSVTRGKCCLESNINKGTFFTVKRPWPKKQLWLCGLGEILKTTNTQIKPDSSNGAWNILENLPCQGRTAYSTWRCRRCRYYAVVKPVVECQAVVGVRILLHRVVYHPRRPPNTLRWVVARLLVGFLLIEARFELFLLKRFD